MTIAPQPPRDRRDKRFVAVFPHSDDFSIFAGALIAKLTDEGAEGYFIRVTNDEMDSHDLSVGETIFNIERETRDVAAYWGIKRVYDFNYKNHYLSHNELTELRHRLISIFRHLRIDIVITFDPWGLYEENPDHYITGMAAEAACWMAGRGKDLPELTDMGIAPYAVSERYYTARGPQEHNCVIDAAPYAQRKTEAVLLHKTPLDNMWREFMANHGDMPIPDAETFARAMLAQSGMLEQERYRYIGG